ncbi:MAG TPA: mechanosensitive ion channel domain-containing protein [Clostridia bacterium]
MTKNITNWLSMYLPEFWGSFILYYLLIFILEVLITYVLLSFLLGLIKRVIFNIISRKKNSYRLLTVKVMVANILKYILWIGMIIFIIYFLGLQKMVNTVLAAAGIGTLVFGLASQDLFKDLIAGITILGEERYLVGDKVEIGSFKGTVENIKLRTTFLKGENGETIILPNSRIWEIKNYSKKSTLKSTDND